MSISSGGIVNADGSLFRKGDRVWLEQLDGVADLRGVSITALDRNGKSVYLFSVPASASDEELAKLVNADDWLIAPKAPMKERPVDGEVLHLGLNAEIIGIDAEAQVLYVKDMDENAAVFGERCAIDCAKAIREHCLIYVNYSAEGDVRSIDFSDFRVGDAVIVDLYDGEKQQALQQIVRGGVGGYQEEAHYELARTYIAQERYTDGAAELERFVQRYPSSSHRAQAYADMGLAYLNMGDKQRF